jgi:pentatricopeptide repeat protein
MWRVQVSKDGRWETALDLLESMTASGLTPNLVTYNSVISACGLGQQWQLAAEMVRRANEAGLRPDVYTYNALLGAYARGLQVCHQSFHVIHHACHALIIHEHAHARRWSCRQPSAAGYPSSRHTAPLYHQQERRRMISRWILLRVSLRFAVRRNRASPANRRGGSR